MVILNPMRSLEITNGVAIEPIVVALALPLPLQDVLLARHPRYSKHLDHFNFHLNAKRYFHLTVKILPILLNTGVFSNWSLKFRIRPNPSLVADGLLSCC